MTRKLATAINQVISDAVAAGSSQHSIGIWLAVEATDADLSKVISMGNTYRYIPKAATATGLVAGDQVVLVRGPGIPLHIAYKLVGDIANVP